MDGEYERWLIAKGNVFMPSAASIAKLVERLRADGWIVDPTAPGALGKLRFEGKRGDAARATGGYAVRTVETARKGSRVEPQPPAITAEWLDHPDREELRLVWPVASDDPLPVRYPLTHRPDGPVAYALELHRSPEYVYPSAETIDPLDTTCACGEDLHFEWDEDEVVPAFPAATGIFAECDACSRTFDPARRSARIANPFDGRSEPVTGGAAYRFALRVDCGTRYVATPELAFSRELVALVESEFGRSFYEVGARS